MTTTTRRAMLAGTALAAAATALAAPPIAAAVGADPIPELWRQWRAAYAALDAAHDAVEAASGRMHPFGFYSDPCYKPECIISRNPIWLHGGDLSGVEEYWQKKLAWVDSHPGPDAEFEALYRGRFQREREADLQRAREFYARWEAAGRDAGLFDARTAQHAAEAELARVETLFDAATPTSPAGAIAKLQFLLEIEGGEDAQENYHDAVRQVIAFLDTAAIGT